MKYFLDCGSNLGQGFYHFRKIYGNQYQYKLFEPNPNCYNKLKRKYRNLINTEIFNKAVYTSDCIKTFRFDTDKPFSCGGSLISNHNSGFRNEQIEVTTQCIDLIKLINDLSADGSEIILKLDVESAEYDILEKMIETGTIFKIKKLYVEFHLYYMTKEDKDIFTPREDYVRNYMRDNKIDYSDW